jgi:integrase
MRSSKTERIKYFTQDELKRLFAVIKNKRDKAIFLIAYRHGLRACEIGLLHQDDVNWNQYRIMLRRLKGSLSHEHPMQADEARILISYLKTRTDDLS